MRRSPRLADRSGIAPLPGGTDLGLDRRLAGSETWELEIGFGKGRYLLGRAAREPGRGFIGVEIAGEYFALAARRLARRKLDNLVLLEGDAAYFAAVLLPRSRFAAVHVYFPDPWPKLRHRKRRLFAPDSIDLLAALVAPGGRLWFATDHLEYGEQVAELLEAYPGARVTKLDSAWAEGARTNYEAKYIAEGRPIVRLEVGFAETTPPHPRGVTELLVAPRWPSIDPGEPPRAHPGEARST